MRKATTTLIILLILALGTSPATAQCIFGNSSFEVGGSGTVFHSWQDFGPVGTVGVQVHGNQAARISGPNTGNWDLAGVWQAMDSAAGEQWRITGHVQHPSGAPLVGSNEALVNIEWRDAADALISYDSFSVATANSPQDEYLVFDLLSTAAPAGTAKARLVLGNLQSPTDPASDVYFDQVVFASTTPPLQDDVQWNDFPGGRTVSFAGRNWRVKGPGYYGPGPNVFSDATDKVWIDGGGALHLTLSNDAGTWVSTEVVLEDALGYGDYILTTASDLDTIDPQAVLGIFLWEYALCYDNSYTVWNAFNEIDIEYSRWQDPNDQLAQFVAQPYNWPGNINRFDPSFAPGEIVSHAMRWLSDRIEYRVWRGAAADESPANMIHQWTYTGPHIPRPEQPRMHLNLWRIAGSPAGDQEVVFTDFNFVPEGSTLPGTGLAPYVQNFEFLDAANPDALGNDDWLVYGNVYEPGGAYLYGYGPFPAPNNPANPAFCMIATGEGGPDQAIQQLVVVSDYSNADHALGRLVEANVYREATLAAEDVGQVYTFAFDAKRGDLAGGSTANAFVKTIDPGSGFATTNFVNEEMTAAPTTWAGYSLTLAITPDLVGQLLQVGFNATATLYEPSAVFYDNITVSRAAGPSDVPPASAFSGATLRQNAPNPFNPATRIAFSLDRPGTVTLTVYDVAGRQVATLHRGALPAGEHHADWNGRADDGRTVAAGRYQYVLQTDAGRLARGMLLLK